SAAHLHQTVETPSIAPWACPSVSVQADVHDPRPNLLADFGAQTHSLQRIGAVAMQNHIGFGHERLQSPELGGYAQVQYGAALAECHFGLHTRLRPEWRVDSKHLRAIAGEESAGHRACQYTREV